MSYTAWPTVTDVQDLLGMMNITLSTAATTSIQQQVIDGVVSYVTRKTHRQFTVTTEDRYFDGNETGEIEINEYVSINSINIVGWFGATGGLQLTNYQEIHRPGFPATRVQIYRGSLPALYRVWIDRFPAGRSNIQVNAAWGYDTTIPADLWDGVAYEAAGMMINRQAYNSNGYLIKWGEADVSEVRNYMDPFKFFNRPYTLKQLINLYKVPQGFFFRKWTKPCL